MDEVPLGPVASGLTMTRLNTVPISKPASLLGTSLALVPRQVITANTKAPRSLALAFGLLAASPVWAYIDPNAGGWLYQLLFPLIVTIGAVWAGLRTRISLWWWRWKNRGAPLAPPSDHDRE